MTNKSSIDEIMAEFEYLFKTYFLIKSVKFDMVKNWIKSKLEQYAKAKQVEMLEEVKEIVIDLNSTYYKSQFMIFDEIEDKIKQLKEGKG